jgi:hypothetical protein
MRKTRVVENEVIEMFTDKVKTVGEKGRRKGYSTKENDQYTPTNQISTTPMPTNTSASVFLFGSITSYLTA